MNKSVILEGLNKMQKIAVLHTSGPLRIIAGAGAGKTKVITRKIAYLIEMEGYAPSSIASITFTNRAANEMFSRVKRLIGDSAKKVTISTYHSLALKFLRAEIHNIGYPRNFNVLDVIDQKQILSSIYKKVGAFSRTMTYISTIDYISKAKMNGHSFEHKWKEATSDGERLKAKIYSEYLKKQKKFKSLDFDDLLIFAVKILKEHKDILKKWKHKFNYILIDEFQDTSNVQYELIKLLSNKNITIVGDPDQTIYTWRGADVNFILDFNKDFKKSKTIKLEQNYRSTKSILSAANRLIKYNKKRLNKVLFTQNEKGESILYERLRNPDAAGRWIVRKIKELQTQKIQLKNMAIFYRSNYLSKIIEQSLITENIEYKLFGSLKFFERQEIKDILAYLKIIIMDDEVAFNRMINVPSRKIGEKAKEKIISFSHDKKLPVMNVIINNFKELTIPPIAKMNLKKFMILIKKHKIASKTNKPSVVLLSFLKEVKYIEIWKKLNEEEKIRNLKEFVLGIQEWEKKYPEKSIGDYLNEIALFTNNNDVDNVNSYISLMTFHASKGLEFDHVFIFGMSEGIFPSTYAIDDPTNSELMEEERRLAYVAITRAKKMIYLVGSQGYIIDGGRKKLPSRFLGELGIKNEKNIFSDYSVLDYELNYTSKTVNWVVGDKLLHKIFGKGVIVKINVDTMEIKFKAPYKLKTLMKNHNSIKRR